MAFKLNDRVKETTTTQGTGTLSLDGARPGFQSFVDGIGTGNQCFYCITDGTNWEVGRGGVTSGSPNTLTRTVVIESSNSDALVDFASGSKDVFVTLPGRRSLLRHTNPQTATYVASTADIGTTIQASGTFTVWTSNPATTFGDGWWMTVKNAGTGIITFNPNTTDLVDGVSSISIGPSCSTMLYVDGTMWRVASEYKHERGAMVVMNSDQSLTTATQTILIWASAVYDTDAFWTATASTRLTVPTGVTQVELTSGIQWSSIADGTERNILLQKNGAAFQGGSRLNTSNFGFASVNNMAVRSAVVSVVAGDYFEVTARQRTVGNLGIQFGASFFHIRVVE